MIRILLSVALWALAATASASSLQELQTDWAVANYELDGDAQESAFESLTERADMAVDEHPGAPEYLIWQGIIKSTYAGKTSGLSALGLVKAARASLEAAMEIDADAMQGSAYTSLGALYYQVPGWPLAFGSDKKARKLLETAIKLNPDGIDSNFFYGDFLLKEKDYAAAEVALRKALAAAPRPGRPLADKGRREEIHERLATIASR